MNSTAKWSSYEFGVYSPDANWNDVSGVYLFCGIGSQNQWVPLYIGQAESFRSRFSAHEEWGPASRLGATHIHALVVPQSATRDLMERELIQSYQPRLNTLQRYRKLTHFC